MMNKRAKYLIDKLKLQRHPEGGYFSEEYRSDELHHKDFLPDRYTSERHFSTAIYFLIEGDDFSSFHRLKSDELWHFYEGGTVKIIMINNEGKLKTNLLGTNFEQNESPLVIIEKNSWFAAELVDKNSYALVGCTVSPGFDFNDFSLANPDELIKLFPHHTGIIEKLTRK
jgi:hypothetical protein